MLLKKIISKLKISRAKSFFQSRRSDVYESIAFGLSHEKSNAKLEIEALLSKAKSLNSPLAPIYNEWRLQFLRIPSLAKAMSGTVSASESALIASAEETRNLTSGLRFLARFIRKLNLVNAEIKSALFGVLPKLLMLLALLTFIDSYFFPIIEESAPRASWSLFAKISVAFFHYAKASSFVIALIVAALFFVWKKSLSTLTGEWRKLFEKTIFYSKYRDIEAAMLLMNLAFLTTAEFSEKRSLETIKKNASPYMQWHIELMLKNINVNATDFGRVLISTGLFNRDLSELILAYTRWTDWHSELERISVQAMDIVVADLSSISSKLGSWLMFLIGGFVILLLVTLGSVFMSLFAGLGIAVSF